MQDISQNCFRTICLHYSRNGLAHVREAGARELVRVQFRNKNATRDGRINLSVDHSNVLVLNLFLIVAVSL